ncbi:MAG TPA: rRNA maturation RNase YbeY [Lamprocystis sp. (in: g-proteobacteria)]|nr:rRNA maturation RNase YbeY [Lamprocystis sp. (in: g-proteobacteria)]
MTVALELDLQVATDAADLPEERDFSCWAAAVLGGRRDHAALTIRIVDQREGQALNLRYRGQDRSTNVLSFPFEVPPGLPAEAEFEAPLGDLVICADVVRREALEQGKAPPAHWAHLVVHGVLHLLEYDHLTDPDAAIMEGLETAILVKLGFPPPYEETPDTP